MRRHFASRRCFAVSAKEARRIVERRTSRKITVYVPSEYSAAQPACVYVALDDLNFAVPNVLDNLIFKHEMPITIVIGPVDCFALA
jgi:enterochelin esterase-like enzyme